MKDKIKKDKFLNKNPGIYSALISGNTIERQEWNGTNGQGCYTFEFCLMNTRISSKSGFILFLFPCMMSVAVLKTRSTEPEEAGTENSSLEIIEANIGNLPAFFFQ